MVISHSRHKKEAVEKLKKLQRDKEDRGLQVKAAEDTIKYQGEVYLKHLEAQRMSGSVIITTRRVLKLLDNTANGLALSKVTTHTIDTMLLEWHQKNYSTNTYLNYIGRLRLFSMVCRTRPYWKVTCDLNAEDTKER